MQILPNLKSGAPHQLSGNLKIISNTVGKEEVFRMIALAEATNIPLLLVGLTGTAKTLCAVEFAKARSKDSNVFILEADKSTKASAVKGLPDMKALFSKRNPKYQLFTPISNADYIVLNEIDKSSGDFKTALYSILSERKIFSGEKVIPLRYKAFIATCNEIPHDEKDSPFWNRFILKHFVTRMSVEQVMHYFQTGHKKRSESIFLHVPTEPELSAVQGVSPVKLHQLISVCYDHCTDRTLSFTLDIVKAVSLIWNIGLDSALVKTADIIAGSQASKQLTDKLIPKEMQPILNKIDMLAGLSDEITLRNMIDQIYVVINGYKNGGKLSEDNFREIEECINVVLKGKWSHLYFDAGSGLKQRA